MVAGALLPESPCGELEGAAGLPPLCDLATGESP
jgi:hypothetical protein